jgi:hypothetical protein
VPPHSGGSDVLNDVGPHAFSDGGRRLQKMEKENERKNSQWMENLRKMMIQKRIQKVTI